MNNSKCYEIDDVIIKDSAVRAVQFKEDEQQFNIFICFDTKDLTFRFDKNSRDRVFRFVKIKEFLLDWYNPVPSYPSRVTKELYKPLLKDSDKMARLGEEGGNTC